MGSSSKDPRLTGVLFALVLLICSSWLVVPGAAAPGLKVRAVNLGGWLVTEGWIKPSLFSNITNKDLLDGTQVQIMSANQSRYLTADNGGGAAIIPNRPSASGWETFRLWRINATTFNLRVIGNQFWGINSAGVLVATATTPGATEVFQIVRQDNDTTGRVRIRAPNGLFLQAKNNQTVTADYSGSTTWNNDPSVFIMNVNTALTGEYQLCNGYGITNATQVLRNHWNTFIVESDFSFIASNGLNAVRIPVGWWIARDPNPPPPFVGGSLEALDNAFNWAQKYNISVIVDLHAAPGSQNPYDHSATRDGSQEWGNSTTINQTVQVIDFLATRYANNTKLLAIELLNEPLAPGVPLSNLTTYYQNAYNAVRRRTSTAYVIMSNRILGNQTELVQFASNFSGTVIDVHYYNLYNSMFDNLTADQNINYVKTNRSSDLASITNQNGRPLTFVGEWSATWNVKNATAQDYQRFAQVQQDVYGNATFGWSYWTLKMEYSSYNSWDMEWMIKNGLISVKN